MDRRIVAGWITLALVGSSPTSMAMQMRDPSTAGMVGYTPLDPITDRINSSSLTSGTTPASSGLPTDPTTHGPQARVPLPPVGPNPVGYVPQPALEETVDQGYPTGGLGWFFRRNPRTAAASSKAQRSGPGKAKLDPAAMPSRLTWDDSGQVPTAMDGTAAGAGAGAANTTPIAGRPAPYANSVPDLPRRQAMPPLGDESDGTAVPGRPAPSRSDVPRQGRPRLTQDSSPAAAKPRPRSGGTINPRAPRPIGPAPVVPTSLPEVDPTAASPAPVGMPPTVPHDRAPVGPQADRDASAGLAVVVREAMDPLPEAPEPPPALPTGPVVVADVGPTPAGMPKLAPVVALVPPEPVVAPEPAASPRELKLAQSSITPIAQPAAVDPDLRRTSGDLAAIRVDKDRDLNRPFASARAAAVGDEIITVHQVETLVIDKFKTMTAGQQVSEADRREILNMLGVMALDHLVDQSLVLQEANHRMKKSTKFKQQFDDFVAKRWRDEKLPALLQKHATTNEYELRRKLAEDGQSYAEMRENFRKEMLEHDFLYTEIKNKISVDLVQLRAYYNEHVHQYDQPARISWREIEVSVPKYPDREAARRQADAIAARLVKKEDFATVAQATSDGPTASKGGLYADMTPGAYAIVPVNDILSTIPEGKISPVIEAPLSFHIVRVESRRPAGPLHFDEVQKQVAEAVFEQNMTRAREEYIAKLRAKTLVRIMPMFDKARLNQNMRPQADPNILPTANR